MIRKKINDNWQFVKGDISVIDTLMGKLETKTIHLPHDAMIHEERTPHTKNGTQTGFWPGGVYTYIKKMDIPEEWREKTAIIEFEGIYDSAMVYVNGELAQTHLYGYSQFCVVLDKYLNYGQENEIRVIANNMAEQNSRWYSGSGIYRNVNLLLGGKVHIPVDGVKISTPSVSAESSVVEINTALENLTRQKIKVMVEVVLSYAGKVVGTDKIHVTMFGGAKERVYQKLCLNKAKLWSTESPALYDCSVKIYEDGQCLDEVQEHFGIRKVDLDAEHGLRINGKQVKLRGTCIHHDNGIIGAATLEKAEERRCRQLKEAGFNSIRSAHHPMSRAMLNACDKIGMLVMDELSDVWTNHKNSNDFALNFLDCVEDEIERMVKKDYNHPCVIIYSSGNEIPEIGTARGAQINRFICNRFHTLDPARYTTNAINGILALGERFGFVIQDLESLKAKQSDHNDNEGSNAMNGMMALMTGEAADVFASHPLMTESIEEACQAMDITGLNYLTGRHVLEKELHPNKTVVGTETFPADIVRLWDIVKKNDHVLGDFTWTGYDYLGEAGCGIFYYNGMENFAGAYPDRSAYIGDLNLIGCRRPISYLRECVYGLREEPYIAVERVDKYGMEHSITPWMLKDNIASWTWQGYEGKPANVDVYSNADEVELFLNGKTQGRKPAGEANGFTASYHMIYEPGELLAISYCNGVETGRHFLQTANDEVQMKILCEDMTLRANGEDLAFVTVKLTDTNGIENLYAEKEITVHIEGAGYLQGFGNADPRAIGSYDSKTWRTYDGYVMAVVRAGTEKGKIKLRFETDDCRGEVLVIEVI